MNLNACKVMMFFFKIWPENVKKMALSSGIQKSYVSEKGSDFESHSQEAQEDWQ